MDVKKSYFNFLQEQGAKEKVQAVIRKGIDEWKQQRAYRYVDSVDPYTGDYSGYVTMISGKKIADIATTDLEVLKAYTGDSEATYLSHCGLRYLRVADRIGWNVNDALSELKGKYISENADALFEEYGIERESDWTDDDIFDTLSEAMVWNENGLNIEWMMQTFPEYEVEDEDMPGTDYIFWINE
jgi:hypothetical protein